MAFRTSNNPASYGHYTHTGVLNTIIIFNNIITLYMFIFNIHRLVLFLVFVFILYLTPLSVISEEIGIEMILLLVS